MFDFWAMDRSHRAGIAIPTPFFLDKTDRWWEEKGTIFMPNQKPHIKGVIHLGAFWVVVQCGLYCVVFSQFVISKAYVGVLPALPWLNFVNIVCAFSHPVMPCSWVIPDQQTHQEYSVLKCLVMSVYRILYNDDMTLRSLNFKFIDSWIFMYFQER